MSNKSMLNSISIDDLAAEIASSVRACYQDLIATFPDERIYGFALYTVDDLVGIVPSASSEQGFVSRSEKFYANTEQLNWLKENDICPGRSNIADNRWSVYEWEHECHGVKHFDSANKLLESFLVKYQEVDSSDSFKIATGEVMAAFTLALLQLRKEQFFQQCGRPLTIFCSKPSSFDTGWLERESARILNPADLYEKFLEERIDWIREEQDDSRGSLSVYLSAMQSRL